MSNPKYRDKIGDFNCIVSRSERLCVSLVTQCLATSQLLPYRLDLKSERYFLEWKGRDNECLPFHCKVRHTGKHCPLMAKSSSIGRWKREVLIETSLSRISRVLSIVSFIWTKAQKDTFKDINESIVNIIILQANTLSLKYQCWPIMKCSDVEGQ